MISKINVGLNLKDYLIGGPLEGREPILIFLNFVIDGGPMLWFRWLVALDCHYTCLVSIPRLCMVDLR
jgi:hypothetical protein